LTPEFTTDDVKYIKVYLLARCLVDDCQIEGYVDTTYIGTSSVFHGPHQWELVQVGEVREFPAGEHTVKIKPAANMDMIWNYVTVLDYY
jgi:hypothetical protein